MNRWIPTLAAALAALGDLAMLRFVGERAAGAGPALVWVVAGGLLGVVAIPFYALGYRLVVPTLRRWSAVGARTVDGCGIAIAILGAIIHGLTAWAIVRDVGAAAADWLESMTSWGTPLLALWGAATVAAVVASVAIVWGSFRLGIWSLALSSPVLVTLAIMAVGAGSDAGLAYLVPAAPNVAHVVFFAVAAYASTHRLGRRPSSLAVAIATSNAQIHACHPVVAQLRPHVRPEEFVARVRGQEAQGYRLAFVREAGHVVAVAGFRTMESLAWGRFLYVDDLVVDETWRSRGVGHRLIEWLIGRARDEGCTEVHLDSRNQRLDAHRFYEREGFRNIASHFRMRLDGGTD